MSPTQNGTSSSNLSDVLMQLRSLTSSFEQAGGRDAAEATAAAAEIVQEVLKGELEEQGVPQNSVIVYVDGSGSMHGTKGAEGRSIFEMALESIESGSQYSHTKPALALWGTGQPIFIKDEEDMEKARRGQYSSGTELAPAAGQIADMAAVASGKLQHAIIVSDGDLFDGEKSGALLRQALKANDKLNLSFVVMRRASGPTVMPMQAFARKLQEEFNNKRVRECSVSLAYAAQYGASAAVSNALQSVANDKSDDKSKKSPRQKAAQHKAAEGKAPRHKI